MSLPGSRTKGLPALARIHTQTHPIPPHPHVVSRLRPHVALLTCWPDSSWAGLPLLLCGRGQTRQPGFWTYLWIPASSLKREQPPPPSVVCFCSEYGCSEVAQKATRPRAFRLCPLSSAFRFFNREGPQFSSPARGTCFSFLAAFSPGTATAFPPLSSPEPCPQGPACPAPRVLRSLKLVSGWPCCSGPVPLRLSDPERETAKSTPCLLAWGNAMDRGAWRATVHRGHKNQTRLND